MRVPQNSSYDSMTDVEPAYAYGLPSYIYDYNYRSNRLRKKRELVPGYGKNFFANLTPDDLKVNYPIYLNGAYASCEFSYSFVSLFMYIYLCNACVLN